MFIYLIVFVCFRTTKFWLLKWDVGNYIRGPWFTMLKDLGFPPNVFFFKTSWGFQNSRAKGLCSPRIFHLSPISTVIRNFLCQWLDILSKKNCCRLSQELFLWICVEALYIYMYEREFPHIFSTVNVCQKDNWSIGKQPDTDRVHLIFRVGD